MYVHNQSFDSGERVGSVVERRTPESEARGSVTSPRSKWMVFGYQAGRAEIQELGNSVSYIQTLA